MKFTISNAIVRSTTGLLLVTLLIKIAGYGEKLVLAYHFGTTDEADAYILVLTLILSLFFFFREIVEPVVLNFFLRFEASESWRAFNYLLRLVLGITVLLVIAGLIFPEGIIETFAPGFNDEEKLLSISLFKIAIPAIIFLSLATVTNTVYNANKIFIFPATGDIAFKSISILSLVLFSNQFGIVSGAIGIVIGALVKLLIHVSKLYKGIDFVDAGINKASKDKMWILAWPLILGMFFSQLTGLIDNIFASYMEKGSIAALSYARKITELPIMLFPNILSIVVFPYFTKLSIERNGQKSAALLLQSMRWIVIVFIPLTIYFVFFSDQIVTFIFRRGAFDENSIALTGTALFTYSIGLLFFAVETVLVIFYYAHADTKTPIFVGIVCVLINICITYLLISYIGYLAIAAALVVQKALKVFILTAFLSKKMPLDYGTGLRFLGKLTTPLVVFTCALLLVKFFLLPTRQSGFIEVAIFLTGSFVGAGVIYILSLHLFRLIKLMTFSRFYVR